MDAIHQFLAVRPGDADAVARLGAPDDRRRRRRRLAHLPGDGDPERERRRRPGGRQDLLRDRQLASRPDDVLRRLRPRRQADLHDGERIKYFSTDLAGNAEAVKTSAAAKVDGEAPDAPTITATDPPSPANDNNPLVRGSAETGSTVSLYASADCSGPAVVAGPAAYFALPGFGVSVPDNSTTSFSATATDAAGNASDCSEPMTYVEDSIWRRPSLARHPGAGDDDHQGPKNKSNKRKVSFAFASTEQGASFECSLDGKPFEACQSPLALKVKRAKHRFQVRATDAAGNTDATPAAQKFKVTEKR